MKNATFAIIAGISALSAWVAHKSLNRKAHKYYEEGPASKEVKRYDNMIELVRRNLDDYRQLQIDEKKAVERAVKRYMRDSGYQQNRNQIRDIEAEAKKQLQRMLDKDPDILKLKKDRDFSIAGLKATLEYDRKIAKLKKQIEKAEEEHKARLMVLDAQDSDMVHETITALKHASENKKDEAVQKAQEAINELEEKLNEAKEEWESKILEKTLERKTEVERERSRLEEQTRSRLDKLDNDVEEYRKKVMNEVISKRTPENYALCMGHQDDLDALSQLKNEREEAVEKICAEAGSVKMLASYLKSRGISKTMVKVLGSLPIVGIAAFCGLAIAKYIAYFNELLKQF